MCVSPAEVPAEARLRARHLVRDGLPAARLARPERQEPAPVPVHVPHLRRSARHVSIPVPVFALIHPAPPTTFTSSSSTTSSFTHLLHLDSTSSFHPPGFRSSLLRLVALISASSSPCFVLCLLLKRALISKLKLHFCASINLRVLIVFQKLYITVLYPYIVCYVSLNCSMLSLSLPIAGSVPTWAVNKMSRIVGPRVCCSAIYCTLH